MIIYYMTRYPDILPECFATNVISISSIDQHLNWSHHQKKVAKNLRLDGVLRRIR